MLLYIQRFDLKLGLFQRNLNDKMTQVIMSCKSIVILKTTIYIDEKKEPENNTNTEE